MHQLFSLETRTLTEIYTTENGNKKYQFVYFNVVTRTIFYFKYDYSNKYYYVIILLPKWKYKNILFRVETFQVLDFFLFPFGALITFSLKLYTVLLGIFYFWCKILRYIKQVPNNFELQLVHIKNCILFGFYITVFAYTLRYRSMYESANC